MNNCFVCGSIYENSYDLIGYEKLFEIVFDFLKKHDFDNIYFAGRNSFDEIIEEIYNSSKFNYKANFLQVVDDDINVFPYFVDVKGNNQDNAVIPFKGEKIEAMKLYSTLYEWMAENSNYMLTFLIDDSDITINIKNMAEKKGVRIFNIANYVDKSILYV